jgi:DNA invertase Pin-like site-specific DNA recombinase
MSSPKNLALSYTRFSNPTQSEGDSESRQQRDFLAFCARHHLRPATQTFIDRGISGYKGLHATKGDLSRLLELAQVGTFPTGTVVVVEAWDRLGRQRPDRQMTLISDLLRTGLKIGVCRLDDVFSEEDFGSHKFTTLSVFCQLAYQESKQKSDRVAASWQQRKKAAREKGALATGRVAAWLRVDNGKLALIPERAEVVKLIFKLAADGQGCTRIVRTLTAKKVPAFGERRPGPSGRYSSFRGDWSRSYIVIMLNDRRVLGEYQPRLANGQPDGDVIPGYYPAAITPQEWDRARQGLTQRKTYSDRSRQRRFTNVFTGLLRHAMDGSAFVTCNKGTAKEPMLFLITAAGADGRGVGVCFQYDIFERAILALLREVTPADVIPASPQASALDTLQARYDALQADLTALAADLDQEYSPGLSKLYRTKERQAAEVKSELDRLRAELAHPLSQSWDETKGLLHLLEQAQDRDALRLRLRLVLHRVISSIEVVIVRRGGRRLLAAQVWFVGSDKHRSYLVLHQQARGNRHGAYKPPQWWARSFAAAGIEAGDLDLRQKEDALALEAELAAVDLTQLQLPDTAAD